jgi:hypothetical protein
MSHFGLNFSPLAVNFATAGMGGMMGNFCVLLDDSTTDDFSYDTTHVIEDYHIVRLDCSSSL